MDAPAHDHVLRGEDDLYAPLHESEKPASENRIGAEAEKSQIAKKNLDSLRAYYAFELSPFSGDRKKAEKVSKRFAKFDPVGFREVTGGKSSNR